MVEDMTQPSDGDLQLPPTQGTTFNSKERDFLRALFLLSGFVFICFRTKWGEILTGSRRGEAMAELLVTIVTVFVLDLRMKGNNDQALPNLVRNVIQMSSNRQLRFLCSFGFLTSSANAEHLTAGMQSWTLVDPNIWKIRDYVKAAVAITISAGLMVSAVGVARSMINRRQQVQELPAAVSAFSITPALQKTRTPFPIIPAIPPTAGSVPGNAIDDALARSPFPTRNNTPLSWL